MRLFFSLLILLSFFARATEPVQVFTDDLGRKVTVPPHPKRIVSLHDLDITIPLIELGVPPVASHGRTRPDGSHFIRSGALLTGVDFDNSSITFLYKEHTYIVLSVFVFFSKNKKDKKYIKRYDFLLNSKCSIIFK